MFSMLHYYSITSNKLKWLTIKYIVHISSFCLFSIILKSLINNKPTYLSTLLLDINRFMYTHYVIRFRNIHICYVAV